jgi:hypothetical protein
VDQPAEEPQSPKARERVGRYSEAGLLGKAAMKLTGEAPTAEDLELLRRQDIGVEGRIAEDVTRIVLASEPIWTMLAEKDLPEDLTVQELDEITECLRGRPPESATGEPPVRVSLKFADPESVLAIRDAIPGELSSDDVNAYRYALLSGLGPAAPEPFIVALFSQRTGSNQVTASMLVAATFLRHEEEFGVVSAPDLDHVHVAVLADLHETIRTERLLHEA